MPPVAAAVKKVSKINYRPSQARMDETTDDLDEWKKSKQLLKPKDQLELADYELKDIVAKVLTTNNSQLPDSLVEFNYALGAFLAIPQPMHGVPVYALEGAQLHKETDEARQQMIEQGIDATFFENDADSGTTSMRSTTDVTETTETEDTNREDDAKAEDDAKSDEEEVSKAEEVEGDTEKGDGDVDAGDGVKTDDADDAVQKKGGKPRKLTNQFNFCERAALTYNNPIRSQETQTVPPPIATFAAHVLQWIIYDGYQEDYAAQQLEKELERERKEKEKAPIARHQAPVKKIAGRAQLSEAVQGRVLECWRVLERMVNQNTYDDIAKDYRYWDDPSDEFREEEGTLLPLWKFSYDKTRTNTVTDIEWNPYYYDMFIVCFGFLDFMKPIDEGAVCLFTIKNPSFPEHICLTESGVMCVDTHPKYPYMVVVGLYDGNVAVFNIQATCKEPAFKSNNVPDKHRGIVWEVKWAPDLPDGELNFFSVAADGKINNWVLMQNDLAVTTVITLYLCKNEVSGPDGTKLKVKSSATCVKFHPKEPLIYLVGTEEGYIYKCSTAYSSMFLLTYNAHNMPVYRIDFNKFNTDIFISCSGDWRIKIWEDNRVEPLFAFDVGACVGDVKWAPYSSTIFAAVTTEGKVYVFDLNINKYKPVCVQAVVSKKRNKLTRIAFNHKMPIIIVGDDKGTVSTLKLSPNLRIPCKAPKKQQHLDQWTLQCMKLEKLLALVREPVTLDLPEDKAGSEES